MPHDPTDNLQPPIVRGDVAIIGMACAFPGARNLAQFWQNIVAGFDAIADVPEGRWDAQLFHDSNPGVEDKLQCKRGGYLGSSFAFNPLKYGTMPRAVEGAEPDQFLVLRTVHEAVEDAGYLNRDLRGTRASFILGRGNYLGAGLANLLQRSVMTQQTLQILKALHPEYSAEQLDAIKKEMRSDLPGFFADTAPGLIPNITTGRVANRLDLTGPTFTVDAACASSLIATQLAVRDLLTGQCDLALAGGVHVFTDVPFLTVFTALGALSASSTIRPFDQDCDGTLPGEGVGIVVLKRLGDAEREGDRIYAVIKGVGSSSDGRALGVTAPRVEGEELALRRAYAMSDCSPETIEMIEAHGTGTPIGDPTELEALRRVFGVRHGGAPSCALGSVKSMIGHTMPAAGVAALIKTALSLYHGVLPPTLNCRRPHELLTRDDSRFYINSKTRPWIHGAAGYPRRAGINAFGFGGVNAHVVMEEHNDSQTDASPSLMHHWETELCMIQADSREGLLREVVRLQEYLTAAPDVSLRDVAYTLNTALPQREQRLAMVASSIADLVEKLARAADRLGDPACNQIKESGGIFYFGDPQLRGGKVAFLFPGLGAQYVNMMSELCLHFPEVRECFDAADQVAARTDGYPLSADIFPAPELSDQHREAATERLAKIERANPALLTANGAMYILLERLGIKADMMTGHSSGEWVAMPASGMVAREEFVAGMSRLEGMWRELSANRSVPKRVMLAVGAGRGAVERLAAELDRPIQIANDNCPHQVVVVVLPEDAQCVREALLARGVFVEQLPYEHGYHTGDFTYATDPLRHYFSSLSISPPNAVLYSVETAAPYPHGAAAVSELLANTFARPVRFRETIDAMYDGGARVFVEVGPRGNLTAFVDDILRGRPHLSVPTNQHRRSDLTTLNHALAKLAAMHVPMDLGFLYRRRSPKALTFNPQTDRPVDEDSTPGTIRIPLHYRLMRVAQRDHLVGPGPTRVVTETVSLGLLSAQPQEIARQPAAAAPASAALAPTPWSAQGPSRSLQEHFQVMEQFLQTQEEVMHAYLSAAAATPRSGAPASMPVSAGHPTVALAGRSMGEPTPDSTPATTITETNSAIVAHAAPAVAAMRTRNLQDVLVSLVSERTGYPIEMLDLDADLEADLGIDSIKRIEILGNLQQMGEATGSAGHVDMEEVAKLKTLRQVVELMEGTVRPQCNGEKTQPGPSTGLTFPGTILRHVPGSEVIVRRRVDLHEELYLNDHRFGPQLSEDDPQLGALPVVPLTVSIETMAEVAALLMPGLRVVGAKDIQASRWIDIENADAQVVLDITATVVDDGRSARVSIRHSSDDAIASAASPVAEATILFGSTFPDSPRPEEFRLRNHRASMHTAAELYSQRRMFHGPSFQGVVSLDAVGEDGLLAQLEVLPRDGLFRSNSSPRFHCDPFLLDAAGQLVGYWPIEHLDEGFVLFPIRIRELSLYRENLEPGERARCRLRISQITKRQLRADMDILAPDGKLWMRIVGWEDWRFYWAKDFYDFWRFPNKSVVSEEIDLGLADADQDIVCRRLAPFGEIGTSIWENLWAHLIFNRQELVEYHSMPEGPRRTEWIFGRAVAKDAVRVWVKRHYGIDLYPADVRIDKDERGKPVVGGHWIQRIGAAPNVSISHKGLVAVAAAARQTVGIDLESITPRGPGFENVAFDETERRILDGVNGRTREEWVARAWCAKEAAGKALGIGLNQGPRTMIIRGIHADSDDILVSCGAGEGNNLPAVPAAAWSVRCVRDGDFVVGLAVGERNGNASA